LKTFNVTVSYAFVTPKPIRTRYSKPAGNRYTDQNKSNSSWELAAALLGLLWTFFGALHIREC